MTLRSAASLSQARAGASDPDSPLQYFDLLEGTINENGLGDKPAQLFNMDESGMPLDPKPPLLICQCGMKHPSSIGSRDKAQITVVGSVSAVGMCIPPMVIWDRKTISSELAEGEVPGTIYGLSSKGWMDSKLFNLWFSNHFLRYAPRARPLLLLFDWHSHFFPDTVQLAAQEQVIVFALPPNTTLLSQLLDKGCFGPLKADWRNVCHRYIKEHPVKVVT